MQSVAAINSSCKVRQLSRSWGPCMMLCEQAACVQVTWKADGTRYLMVLCEWGTYLIDRSFSVRRVQMRFPNERYWPCIIMLARCSACLMPDACVVAILAVLIGKAEGLALLFALPGPVPNHRSHQNICHWHHKARDIHGLLQYVVPCIIVSLIASPSGNNHNTF